MTWPKPLRVGVVAAGPCRPRHTNGSTECPPVRTMPQRMETLPSGTDSAPCLDALVTSSWTMSEKFWAAVGGTEMSPPSTSNRSPNTASSRPTIFASGTPSPLPASPAEQLLPGLVHRCAADEAAIGDRLDHGEQVLGPVMQFAGEQILALLRALALGHVDDGGEHAAPALALDRIEPDLDREFAAVLAPAAQLTARTHGSGLRLFGEIAAQGHVLRAHRLGHQKFHALAEQLFAAVAEQGLGRRID